VIEIKFPVWKEARITCFVMIFAFILFGVFFTVLAVMYDSLMYYLTFFCLFGIALVLFIYRKLLFCTVVVSRNGIDREYKKKKTVSFKWEDIFEIRILIIRVKHGKNMGQNVPIMMISKRNITYDDKKHVSNIVRESNSISIIAMSYTKELENEIKKYYTKDIEIEKFQ
jgi:hypothetical protein